MELSTNSRSSGLWHETVLYDFCCRLVRRRRSALFGCDFWMPPAIYMGRLWEAARTAAAPFSSSRFGRRSFDRNCSSSFCSLANCADGKGPVSGFDAAGNLTVPPTLAARAVMEQHPDVEWSSNSLRLPALDGKKLCCLSFNGTKWPAAKSRLISRFSGQPHGTTGLGGAEDSGVVFELSPTASGQWTETTLHTFSGFLDGAWAIISSDLDSLRHTTEPAVAGGYESVARGAGYGTIFQVVALNQRLDGNRSFTTSAGPTGEAQSVDWSVTLTEFFMARQPPAPDTMPAWYFA